MDDNQRMFAFWMVGCFTAIIIVAIVMVNFTNSIDVQTKALKEVCTYRAE